MAYYLFISFSISPQVLKKDLYFDPEFWNLIALRTSCLKLMSEKVVSSALEEIMEDKWILNYRTKEPGFQSRRSACRRGSKGTAQAPAKKRQLDEDADAASKRLKAGPGKDVNHTGKGKGARPLKVGSSMPMRRSFWQLDRHQDNGELRRTTRLSEKNPPKRRIRRPKWLVEDSGTQNNAPPKIKRYALKHQKHQQASADNKSEAGQIKNAKHKSPANSHPAARENNKHVKGLSLDGPPAESPPQIILELSLPDNELMGTFSEDACNRQRGFPQMLLYKPTVKVPAAPQPVKTTHRGEVILRARDTAMFIQQLHCYSRRLKGKGNGQNIQASVSTITRSSVQGSPSKGPQRALRQRPAAQEKAAKATVPKAAQKLPEKSTAERKAAVSAQATVKEETARPQSTGRVSPTKTRQASEKSVAEIKVQTVKGVEVAEAPSLDKGRQPQARELCEESAVEMKVTIASQTPAPAKETQMVGFDKIARAQSGNDASKTTSSDKFSPEGADPTPSASQRDLSDGKHLDVDSLSSQTETEEASAAISTSSSEGDILPELTVENAKNPTNQDHVNDISALTLVTEMVTELSPETLAHRRPSPQKGASKESTAGSQCQVPPKSHTTSSCSGPELGASAVETQDMAPESPENSEAIESEESRLEYCCTFCNKVFKGSRVVAHAMFHYRKDECMFCSVIFKDDLLAMMHLSDHIEKLKKIAAETKDIPRPNTSSKAKNTNVSSARRGRPRKSEPGPKSASTPDSSPPGPRKLRSSDKPEEPSLRDHKQSVSQPLNSKTPVHKVNGHVGKTKDLGRLRRDTLKSEEPKSQKQQELTEERTSSRAKTPRSQEIQSPGPEEVHKEFSSSADDRLKEKESLNKAAKADNRVPKEKTLEQEKKCLCPVKGCPWFADLSKSRVAVLYHALEDHHGDVEPLELAFRLGNNRCSICMRVCWSFEHFQHHVERHKLSPRHPCPHRGCTARFKSGMEMRRHARRHSPLQAVCCLPGCSQLFICLWALNLHEKVHYASKPSNHDKKVKQEDKKINEPKNDTTVNKTTSTKATRKAAQPEFKGSGETRDSHVLKNLSNKDTTSAKPSGSSRRLRQTLRKARRTKLARLNRHKIISSSLVKAKRRMDAKGHKKRGRPPKSKEATADENASAALIDDAVKAKRDQRSAAQPDHAKAAEGSTESKKTKEERRHKVQDDVQNTDASNNHSRSRNRQMKNNSASATPAIVNRLDPSVTSAADKTQKQTTDKMKKPQKAKKETSPQTSSLDSSKLKKGKAASGGASLQIKKKRPVEEEEEASAKPEKSDSVVTRVEGQMVEKTSNEEQSAEVENPESTANHCGDSAPAAPAETPAPAATASGEETTEKPPGRKRAKSKEKTTPAKTKMAKDTPKEANKKAAKARQAHKGSSTSKTSGLAEGAADVEGKDKERTSSVTSDSSVPTAKKTQTKKSRVKKSSEPNGVAKKRKLADKNGEAKVAKKKRRDPAIARSRKTTKPESTAQAEPPRPEGEQSPAAEEGKVLDGPPAQSAPSTPGYSLIVNGQASPGATKSMVCKALLDAYSKKPYLRPPPTAYLDEKFITMPKRKKELSLFHASSHRSSAPQEQQQQQQAKEPSQRQRCANCFATFNSAQELQSHVQLKKCSSLFGFDSDDEAEQPDAVTT